MRGEKKHIDNGSWFGLFGLNYYGILFVCVSFAFRLIRSMEILFLFFYIFTSPSTLSLAPFYNKACKVTRKDKIDNLRKCSWKE